MSNLSTNSVVKLFVNHGEKPFDATFIKALNALIFLEKPTNDIFNTAIAFTVEVEKKADTVKIKHPSDSKKQWPRDFHKGGYYSDPDEQKYILSSYIDNYNDNDDDDITMNLIQAYQQNMTHQTTIEQKKLNYTIGEWLLARLFININQPDNTERTNIYQLLDILKDKLVFSQKVLEFQEAPKKDTFTKLSSGDLFIKVGLHAHIKNEFDKHAQLFTRFFQEHRVGMSLVQDLSVYKPNGQKQAFLQQIIKHHIDYEHIQSFIHYQTQNKNDALSKITTPFWEHLIITCVNDNQSLSDNNKRFLLKQALDKKLLDYILPQNHEFLSDFEQYFQKSLKTNFLFSYLKASQIDHNPTQQLILKHIDHLGEHNQAHILFVNTLLEKASVAQKQHIYDLLDFNDAFIRKSIDYIQASQVSEQPRYELMQSMVNLTASFINKENLAHLISLDIRYMDFCNPLFLTIKLDETLPENIAENETSNRNRLKI
jgi:hypothetical protein